MYISVLVRKTDEKESWLNEINVFSFNRVLWFSSCTAWETRRYNITFSFQAYSVSRLNQLYFLSIDRQFLFYHSSLDFFSCFFSYLFLFLIVLSQFYCQLKMNPMINFTFLSGRKLVLTFFVALFLQIRSRLRRKLHSIFPSVDNGKSINRSSQENETASGNISRKTKAKHSVVTERRNDSSEKTFCLWMNLDTNTRRGHWLVDYG